jgi:hypothetical protein
MSVSHAADFIYVYSNAYQYLTASMVKWSEFLATDPEARVRFPALPEKKSSGSGTGFTQLLDRKVAAPV